MTKKLDIDTAWKHDIMLEEAAGGRRRRNCLIHTSFIHLQGMPTFVEEGRYKDVSKFPVLSVVGSVKCLQEDLSSPELRLFSASSFTGEK